MRNLPDGTVEVQAEGDRKQLEKLINHLKMGPPGARVEKVTTNWSGCRGNYSDFSVGY